MTKYIKQIDEDGLSVARPNVASSAAPIWGLDGLVTTSGELYESDVTTIDFLNPYSIFWVGSFAFEITSKTVIKNVIKMWMVIDDDQVAPGPIEGPAADDFYHTITMSGSAYLPAGEHTFKLRATNEGEAIDIDPVGEFSGFILICEANEEGCNDLSENGGEGGGGGGEE